MTERQSDTPNHFSQAEKMVSLQADLSTSLQRIHTLECENLELRSTAAVKLDELRGVIAEKEADVAKVIRARNQWEDACRVAQAEVETLKRTVRELDAERDRWKANSEGFGADMLRLHKSLAEVRAERDAARELLRRWVERFDSGYAGSAEDLFASTRTHLKDAK